MRKRRMFPHTVTVYNCARETDKTNFTETFTNYITILRGVFLDETKAVNVRTSGLAGADNVTLYIPRDVPAVDGITGEPKQYAEPLAFSNAPDKSKLWSLTLNGKGDDTFFVKGVVVEPDKDYQFMNMRYDGVYDITKIDNKDFGGLPHWEVGGV